MNKQTAQLLEQHFDTAFAAPDLPAGKAGGIKKLRELILTLAMQGKLVEQNPNDPPASELLKEIEAEKQQLIKEKKIKKPKVLPPIKPEEIPYELPQSWEWVRLGEISEITGGFAFKSSKYVNDGVRVIRISDFDEKGFKSEKVVRYPDSDDGVCQASCRLFFKRSSKLYRTILSWPPTSNWGPILGHERIVLYRAILKRLCSLLISRLFSFLLFEFFQSNRCSRFPIPCPSRPSFRMFRFGFLINLMSVGKNGYIIAIVPVSGGDKSNTAVQMDVIVPICEGMDPFPGFQHRIKWLGRIFRPVFQGFE